MFLNIVNMLGSILVLAMKWPTTKSDEIITTDFEIYFPDNYSRFSPPKKGGPVIVYTAVQVLDIYSLQEETMDFRIHFFYINMWKDYRLNLSFLDSSNPSVIPLDGCEKIWQPSTYIENSKSTEVVESIGNGVICKIFPDGTIFRSSIYLVVASCPMNLRNYPMDTQRCAMKLGMFFHSDVDVLLKWAEERKTFYFESLVVDNNVQLPQFEIQNTSAEKVTQEWKTGNFTYLLATFEFQRNVHFYVLTSYIPSSLVVVVSWVSFWLDVKAAPARVALGITSLLTLATQMVQSHLSLPPVSYVKALDVWMFFCLFMVFSSLIEYACSYTLAAISSNPKSSQSSFDRMGFQLRRNIIFGASNIEVKDTTEGPTEQEVEHKAQSSTTHPRENIVPSLHPRYISTTVIDYISRILFPFSFVVFLIVYWSIYASDQ